MNSDKIVYGRETGMENNQKVPSKSSKGALLIAGILIVILIAAVSAIIYLLIKNFENKDTVQSETTNQSVSEEVVKNEEIQPQNQEQEYEKEQEQALNTAESTDEYTASKAQPNTAQDNQAENKQMQAVIPDGKSIFLPVEMKIYDMNGDIIEQTKYNWLKYKDNTYYNMNYVITTSQDNYTLVDNIRRGDNQEQFIKVFSKGQEVNKLYTKNEIMYQDETNTIIQYDKMLLNYDKKENILSLQDIDYLTGATALEIYNETDGSTNMVQIVPDNKVVEDKYIDNKLVSHTEYEDYYYEGVFITSLYNTDFYEDDNITSSNSKYFKDIETIDDNTVKIIFKDVEYGEDEEVKAEKTIEYIIHKHIQDDENIVVPVAIH